MTFKARVILHIIGILVTLGLLSYLLTMPAYYVTKVTLALILILQVAVLIRYVNLTNRQLARFISAVKYSDYSQSFQATGVSSSFSELGQAMDALMDKFRTTHRDKESSTLYLTTLIEQLPIAICSINDNNEILLSNRAFRRLFKKSKVTHLDELKHHDPTLVDFLNQLDPGNEKVYKLENGANTHLKSSCIILRTQGRQEKLISLQNIQGEMESQELEAWQNLIRVMSHEIMNSVTPITSLADSSSDYIEEARAQLTKDDKEIATLLDDAKTAMQTISNRGQGLIRFVDSYRSMMRLPPPNQRTFRIQSLFSSVEKLMSEAVINSNCAIKYSCRPDNLELKADPEQMEQALLNLIKNALDAVAGDDKPRIHVSATLADYGTIILEVADNGIGMDGETLNNLFTPFFTTKREGTGVGMSIVKKIIHMNGGKLNISSAPNRGSKIQITVKY